MPAGEKLNPLPRVQAADIPSVDKLLRAPLFQELLTRYGRTAVTATLRAQLARLRRAALAGELDPSGLDESAIAAAAGAELAHAARPALRPVFNLTGTVLHTNLGRALLPVEAIDAVVQAMSAPVNLEYDLASGGRGERDTLIERSLCELTGAAAALVVNNNAAAVLLMLSVLASRREVLVSRGELIEIGGSFRLPDIMRRAGARLREVGTTNRTHLADYAGALGPRSALLLKVHTSNYAITGFTASVSLRELVKLGQAHGIPVAVDLGSGSLVDLRRWQLPAEPIVHDAIAAGADLVAFSGDKLLGGPQAGLVVGRADLIKRLRREC
jgi:L-seryl-tRNA(Ser) seleniumtransferase